MKKNVIVVALGGTLVLAACAVAKPFGMQNLFQNSEEACKTIKFDGHNKVTSDIATGGAYSLFERTIEENYFSRELSYWFVDVSQDEDAHAKLTAQYGTIRTEDPIPAMKSIKFTKYCEGLRFNYSNISDQITFTQIVGTDCGATIPLHGASYFSISNATTTAMDIAFEIEYDMYHDCQAIESTTIPSTLSGNRFVVRDYEDYFDSFQLTMYDTWCNIEFLRPDGSHWVELEAPQFYYTGTTWTDSDGTHYNFGNNNTDCATFTEKNGEYSVTVYSSKYEDRGVPFALELHNDDIEP